MRFCVRSWRAGTVDASWRPSSIRRRLPPRSRPASAAAVQTTIGGKLDKGRFHPLPITAKVHMISEGRFISESNGAVWHSGLTAVLQSGNYTIVATSRPVNLYDRSLFYAHGQNPKRFDAVIVKSPHCQRHMFDDWAEVTINVDAPGSTSADLRSLGHTKCPRPIFPLDDEVEFSPSPRIYRRRKEQQ